MRRRWKVFLIFPQNMHRTWTSEQHTFLEGRISNWYENQGSTLHYIQQTPLVWRETDFPYSYPSDARGRDSGMIHKPQPPVCLLMVLQIKSQRNNHERNQLSFQRKSLVLQGNIQKSLWKLNSLTDSYGSTEVKTNAFHYYHYIHAN